MVSSENISYVLTDWTRAVTHVDIDTIQKLLKVEPELLWTPMTYSPDAHLESRLVQLACLGSSFQPLCAIHICLIENKSMDCIRVLLNASTPHDLDTRFWGQADNTTLHLAYFLHHTAVIDLLLAIGVGQPENKLGSRPQDLAKAPLILGSLHKKKSEHHYFRRGKVKETRQKVLEESTESLKPTRREVAQLAQRSAVKNNPLYQKFEKIAPRRPPDRQVPLVETEHEPDSDRDYVLVETEGDPHFVFESLQEIQDPTPPEKQEEEEYEGEILVEYDPANDHPVWDIPNTPPQTHTPPEPLIKSPLLTHSTLTPDRKMKRRSGSQKAAWSMSMSSWAAILDREFNLSDLNQAMIVAHQEQPPTEDSLDTLLVSSSETFSDESTEPAPSPVRASPPARTPTPPPAPISTHGKFYLRVNCVQDILLPLPKDRAFVRCVVSDGRFEYMSRYEVLSQTIQFDFESLIDAQPDMIITLSLHVRPDFIMKAKKPFSRLFSSRKKKECLSGYVHKEDGAIGQSRFALAHMIPACHELTYNADFDCFNAWYSKSFKERHRQKKNQDVLKVVGNFHVQMLYLTQSNSFPKTLATYSSLA